MSRSPGWARRILRSWASSLRHRGCSGAAKAPPAAPCAIPSESAAAKQRCGRPRDPTPRPEFDPVDLTPTAEALEALVRLLLRKEIFTPDELAEELRNAKIGSFDFAIRAARPFLRLAVIASRDLARVQEFARNFRLRRGLRRLPRSSFSASAHRKFCRPARRWRRAPQDDARACPRERSARLHTAGNSAYHPPESTRSRAAINPSVEFPATRSTCLSSSAR